MKLAAMRAFALCDLRTRGHAARRELLQQRQGIGIEIVGPRNSDFLPRADPVAGPRALAVDADPPEAQ